MPRREVVESLYVRGQLLYDPAAVACLSQPVVINELHVINLFASFACRARHMGRLAKIAYGLTFGALVVSWIVLLSGNGRVACSRCAGVRCTSMPFGTT